MRFHLALPLFLDRFVLHWITMTPALSSTVRMRSQFIHLVFTPEIDLTNLLHSFLG